MLDWVDYLSRLVSGEADKEMILVAMEVCKVEEGMDDC